MKIAVIPARGGSKRIPNKNIKTFHGKPIIYWPIKKAIESGLFDKIIVSTDSKNIAEIASSYGAEIPFIRPDEFSDDFSTTNDVMCHALNFIEKKETTEVEFACCIYPTSVFFNNDELKMGLRALEEENWEYSFSVSKFNYPIDRAFILSDAGGVKMIYPQNYNSRSQDFKTIYHDAAQFYWGRKLAWLEKLQMFSQFSFPIKIPSWKIQDIDEIEDWKRAEILFRLIKNEN